MGETMNIIARSKIRLATNTLLADQDFWLRKLENRRLNYVVQDYRHGRASFDDVGTVLAFELGYNIIQEDE
jgi:hypothetical protein